MGPLVKENVLIGKAIMEGNGDAARQDLALLVEELLQELGVLVVDILNATLLETAVLLLLRINRRSGQITDF